jgi:hypothetical protein
MKVTSPLGEYPYVFRRLERRGQSLAVVGTVAGIESSLLLERDDLRLAARRLAGPLAAAVLVTVWRRRRSASRSPR